MDVHDPLKETKMENNNSLSCWNCKKTIEHVGMNCPHCNVFIDKEMIDRIAAGGITKIPSGGLQPGIVFDERYEIIKPLGRGGMGVVYKAHDNFMDRDVALKLIPRELSMDPKAISDLKRETALALDLTHEHIVRFYNLDTWESYTFVTMEYVQCGTLSHLMVEKGGSLSLNEALPLLTQIGQALDYAHGKNPPVVHLDLKPLNILLTVDGYAKITDFGLARVLRDLATRVSAWEAAGSLAYMAPEQIRGKGIGTWTDVYALAAVAYELLSGHPPFYTGDLRWQIMHEEVDPILNMPEHVNRALLIGLAKEISLRPKTAGEFVKMISNEIPVPDIYGKTAPGNEEVAEEADAETEESSVWKEEWFENFVADAEKKSPESSKKPIFVYGIIAFLCLLVVAQLSWILYSQNYITLRTVDRLISFVMPEQKEPKTPDREILPADHQKAVSVTGTEAGKKTSFKIPVHEEKAADSPAVGGVSLATTPPGAMVRIDDREQLIAPVVVSDLPEGSHIIKVSKEGFAPWQGKVLVQSSQVLELQIDLSPMSGAISIDSQPAEAVVFIGGNQAGITPLVLDQEPAGELIVELQKERYETWKKTFDIQPGKGIAINATLTLLPGKLRITSSPKSADVYIAGNMIGKTPLAMDKIREEEVLVEVRKSCYDSVKKTVVISPGKEAEVDFILKPSCGDLVVKSLPEGAAWFLNGELKGKTPGKAVSLEKGVYKIKVAKENYADWEVDVTVNPQKNKPVIAALDPIAELDENLYLDPVTEMEFLWVEKGCFQMGSIPEDPDRSSDESPVHEVCLDGFWMGKYEVTQRQWVKIIGKNPSSFQNGLDYPVENVSWNDTQTFLAKLNELNQGKAVYRLATEAEWEYACRSGGKSEKYAGSDNPDLVAWYKNNSMGTTHPVGKKKPNGLGVFDMSGNVFEWVEDVYLADAYLRHKSSNPIYKGEGAYRVCRGGSWLLGSKESRSANRSYYFATSRNYNLGFRVVRNP
jgi:formylglycine-generating enzyme required for sulfatase activity/serine/threonine protein kinase